MIYKLLRLRKPSFDDRYGYLEKEAEDHPPLRSVLLGQEELAAHCKVMAEREKPVAGNNTIDWNKNLAGIADCLDQVNAVLADTDSAPREVLTMKEWTTADYFLIQGYVNKLKALLGKVHPSLPFVRKGINGRQPRLYSFLVKIVSHTDTQITFQNLVLFFKAYQQVSAMSAMELKAVPALVRYVLIENIRRLAVRFALAAVDSQHARDWAEKLIAATPKDKASSEVPAQELLSSGMLMKGVFTAELIGQLLKHNGDTAHLLSLVSQRLAEKGHDAEHYVYKVQETLAADKISLRNSISALRMLDAIDWHDFTHEVSVVESIYMTEPCGIYAAMDFNTRNYYRLETFAVATKAARSETAVAQAAMEMAGEKDVHVGVVLLGEGRRELETRLGIPPGGWLSNIKKTGACQLLMYLAGIVGIASLISGLLIFLFQHHDTAVGWVLITAALLLISTGYISTMIVDRLVMLGREPELLPRMDYFEGIPEASRTLVVVPGMLTSLAEVDELATALEVRFLGNRHENLHFALLTDFKDAAYELSAEEEALLATAAHVIGKLNEKYGDKDRFFLLHRHRRWNAAEQCWMGHERKRGKLNDLNYLLRGSGEENFLKIVGNKEIFAGVKYVITLDADTQLLPETAWKMVATMAHPLNRPVYCEKRGRVVAGYGVLQPLVKLDISEMKQSMYHQLTGSGPDVGPYLRTFPDVYQDLFKEGSFIGKGIYDVDIFLKALGGKLPDNRVLSHDLLEGGYMRSGMLNDVKLNESAFTYWVDLKRRHRWIRGDWQIAAWLGPRVPGPDGRRSANPLSALSRWKIFDNLRTSLFPVVSLLLYFMGWTVYVPLVAICPTLILLWSKLTEPKKFFLRRDKRKETFREIRSRTILDLYALACLPHEAWCAADATCRAVWRMMVSRKKLLEWVPSGKVHGTYTSLAEVYKLMWIAPVLGLVSLVWLQPLGLLWVLAPLIAWRLNLPAVEKQPDLRAGQQEFLRSLARKTWAYFEEFTNAEHHWLPPDHYQEFPAGKVAAYTSPTNLGLGLLADLSAYDFGYLAQGEFIKRTHQTLHTIGQLERYKGHFYNWYNTHTLKPSYPRYVSSVDSGNFAGHLLVMRQGVKGMIDQPLFTAALFNGLLDTLRLCRHTVLTAAYGRELADRAGKDMFSLQDVRILLERFESDIRAALVKTDSVPEGDSAYWLSALRRQCGNILADMRVLAPWAWAQESDDVGAGQWPQATVTLRGLADGPSHGCLQGASQVARERVQALEQIYAQCTAYADMEYDFLYDEEQHLLSIGYRVEEGTLDVECYDVLASEARLATYVAVSQGKLPVESWFALRRPLVNIDGNSILQSANGTMFEYLMPLLVMPAYDDTLLHLACRSAVTQQISYGRQHQVPWGISESCYSTTDLNLNYQYKVNGVPALSLKNGRMAEERVMSSYAAAMALMVAPEQAAINLERMAAEGFDGRYGLIESVDYMPSRMPHGQTAVPVRTFMAHHQGMSLLSLHYLLADKRMHRYFEADPELRSAVMLLQEKIPWDEVCYIDDVDAKAAEETADVHPGEEMGSMNVAADDRKTRVQLLSNGRYHLMATASGASFSRWNDVAVTRWRDTRNTNGGLFFRIREPDTDMIWSSVCHDRSGYNVTFLHGQLRWTHFHQQLELNSVLAVSPEDDLEVRQVTIYNHSDHPRYVEITGYADLLLRPMSGQPEHTILEAEVRPAQQAILCRRRTPSDTAAAELFFRMKAGSRYDCEYRYETDITPESLQQQTESLRSGIIATIKCYLTLPPQSSVTADICLGIAGNRQACEALLERTIAAPRQEAVFAEAARHVHTLLQQTNATEKEVLLSTGLLGRLIFTDNLLLQGVVHGYPACCSESPTILLRVRQTSDMQAVEQLVELHTYWRLHGLSVNLVILNEDQSSYRHFFHRLIYEFINAGPAAEALNRQYGGILVRGAHAALETLDSYSANVHEIVSEQWIFQGSRLKGFNTGINKTPVPATGALINL
ncbi:Putative glucoamylase [Chitinophaga eiseniae]|uniref:Putative glucoamylase n=1 Tax=Chitinophaga eiseniae TaxID=634771 RepID=A0A1T4T5X1_9BACT|nr:glucoamylase family protein [Chitinophaga eiseniae]SKA35787.1 Putative glucoamylase [Chitinophaga eiseniae]